MGAPGNQSPCHDTSGRWSYGGRRRAGLSAPAEAVPESADTAGTKRAWLANTVLLPISLQRTHGATRASRGSSRSSGSPVSILESWRRTPDAPPITDWMRSIRCPNIAPHLTRSSPRAGPARIRDTRRVLADSKTGPATIELPLPARGQVTRSPLAVKVSRPPAGVGMKRLYNPSKP